MMTGCLPNDPPDGTFARPGISQIAFLWPDYRPTSLVELPHLARLANVGRVFVKLEGERPLGNFKVLGGMLAGLRELARAAGARDVRELCAGLVARESLPRLLCASDGNHGLAVAAAANRVGARASIYLPTHVSEARAKRIGTAGGEVVWISGTYDDAVDAAATAAARGEGLLIPDTTSDPGDPVVRDVMEGYGLLSHELVAQFRDDVRERPSHLLVQAGVGGLAAAMAEGLAELMRDTKGLIVVEPESAACVAAALAAGQPVRISGSLRTCAEMLSCGVASAPAVQILLRHQARSVLVSEDELQSAVRVLRRAGGPNASASRGSDATASGGPNATASRSPDATASGGLNTTPSGAAGLAGFLRVASSSALRAEYGLNTHSAVLLVITEAATPVA